jgi:hypothetical protein
VTKSNDTSPLPSALDALLRPKVYDPRDFSYFEDAKRRWTAVAVFGGILGITAGLFLFAPWLSPANGPDRFDPVLEGIRLVLTATVVLFLVSPLLWFLHSEATFAGLASGSTLFVVGLLMVAGMDRSWFVTLAGLYVVGAVCAEIGGILSIRLERILNSEEQ